jgi:Terpene synthase family 2, C-terminal metal binding
MFFEESVRDQESWVGGIANVTQDSSDYVGRRSPSMLMVSGWDASWSLRPLARELGFDTPRIAADHLTPTKCHATSYEAILRKMIIEYASFASRRVLLVLARKAVDLYAATAPYATVEETNALCRLSLEWWLINSALDHKYTILLSHDDCRRLLCENAMMFHDRELACSDREIEPLQRGFRAVAKLAWQKGASTVWMDKTAAELLRYIFSRDIGVKGRLEEFDSIDEVIHVRRDDGGMIAQILLTEFGHHLPTISDETRQSVAVTDALQRLSTVAALLNDVASVVIDRNSGALNSVLFIYEQHRPPMGCNEALHRALEDSCLLLRQEYASFLNAERAIMALTTDPPEVLERYTSYLHAFLQGYWNWQVSCPSYFDMTHPVEEFRRRSEYVPHAFSRG